MSHFPPPNQDRFPPPKQDRKHHQPQKTHLTARDRGDGTHQWNETRDEHPQENPSKPPPLVNRAPVQTPQFRATEALSQFVGNERVSNVQKPAEEGRSLQKVSFPAQSSLEILSPAAKARIEAERQKVAVEMAMFKRKMALAKVEICEQRVKILRPGG
mmetsp:Transcript_33576/g.46874  ORF Transcript_33576/g.46874 Transcript_33576/m.46874 type:complete len:158 (+) Transcript_33576:37-510(+)